MKSTTLFISAMITLLLSNSLVFAQFGIPHQFYGDVTVNGAPAPDGTIVSAKIDGTEVASTTTRNGVYGQSPAEVFYVNDPNDNRVGKIIQFFVNGVDTGQTAIFYNGYSTNLDLAVTIAQPSSGGGSTGGGGGGGGAAPTTTGGEKVVSGPSGDTSINICQERWLCSDWSECENGIQRRTCNDESNCGTNNNEPMSAQPCSQVVEEISPRSLPITSMIIAAITNPLYGGIFAVVLAGILYTVYRFVIKKKKS